MKPHTQRSAGRAGVLAVIAGALAAPPGCDEQETDIQRCSPACAVGQECVAGQCQCLIGTAPCSTGCADLTTDKLNCGQCNVTCRAAQECVNSSCVCPDNKTLCFDQCVDLASDAQFCGSCTTACDEGQFCNASSCEIISNCDQVSMDQYEGNDTCALARVLPQAAEGAPTPVKVSDPTLHHTDHSLDTDWYSILATEGTHACSPLSGQCYYVFDIAFTPPDAAAHARYRMCVSEGTCGASETCTAEGDWNAQAGRYELSLSWEGVCGLNDNALFYVRIARDGGEESCEQYSLEYRMSYTNESCP